MIDLVNLGAKRASTCWKCGASKWDPTRSEYNSRHGQFFFSFFFFFFWGGGGGSKRSSWCRKWGAKPRRTLVAMHGTTALVAYHIFKQLIVTYLQISAKLHLWITVINWKSFEWWSVPRRKLCRLQMRAINTLRPRRNGQHFTDDIFKRIFFNENVWISIKISLKFVPKGSVYNIPALVQIMAWRRPGDKPLSEPMMGSLPTHICVTRPQWGNHLKISAKPEMTLKFHCWWPMNITNNRSNDAISYSLQECFMFCT